MDRMDRDLFACLACLLAWQAVPDWKERMYKAAGSYSKGGGKSGRGFVDDAEVSMCSINSSFSIVLCVCFFPFILDVRFVGRTSRGHTGGTSHRISHSPSFCGACLTFSREKDSAVPFPRRP